MLVRNANTQKNTQMDIRYGKVTLNKLEGISYVVFLTHNVYQPFLKTYWSDKFISFQGSIANMLLPKCNKNLKENILNF